MASLGVELWESRCLTLRYIIAVFLGFVWVDDDDDCKGDDDDRQEGSEDEGSEDEALESSSEVKDSAETASEGIDGQPLDTDDDSMLSCMGSDRD